MNKNKSKINPSKINKQEKTSVAYHDFMKLFFVVAFLIIDFLPYFKTYQIIAPQYLYLSLLNIIIGIYIYFSVDLQSSGLITIFKKSYVFKIYLAFVALCAVSVITAKNTSVSIISIAEIGVILITLVNLIILFYNRLYLIYKVAFIVGICALLQAGYALYNFQIIATTSSIGEALNSNFLKGNTGNINIFSASILYKIPFIYISLVYFKDWKKWVLAASLIAATCVIFLINARASLLALIIITIVFLITYIKDSEVKKTAFKQLTYLIVPIIISVITVNLIFSSAKLEERFTSTSDRLTNINTQDGSINRRLTFYKAALALAKKNPITGIGLGNFKVESIPYDLSGYGSIPLNAHDDFLELAAETGFVNGILYLTIFIVLLFINLKRYITTKDKAIKKIALLALLLLIVYGMDSLFNFPLFRPTMQLCFCFLMVFTIINQLGINNASKIDKKYFASLIVIAMLPLYFTYQGFKMSHLEYMIQTDNINFESSGVLTGDNVVNENPKFPNIFQSAEPFVEYAGIYYFREKKYEKALQLLDSANKINPYTGRPDFYKYLIATEMGNSDSAYTYIKRAFYNRPVNYQYYQSVINMAANKTDSTEIIKLYNSFAVEAVKPAVWAKTFVALNNMGYSKTGLDNFKQIAKNNFPKDTLVTQAINASSITNIIIIGQALFAEGKQEQALEKYKEGLVIEPNNIYINQNIGFYYYNIGQPKQAINFFKKALNKPGLTDGKTEFYIGKSYTLINDNENACKYYKLAVAYPDAKAQIDLCN